MLSSRVRKALAVLVAASVVGGGSALMAGHADAATNVGDAGPTIPLTFNGVGVPKEAKVQRRTWYGHGTFWAVMAKGNNKTGFSIWRWNKATRTWTDTTVTIDTRSDTAADVYGNGKYVFVATHVVATSSTNVTAANAYLQRYEWSATKGTWVRSAGYPKVITTTSVHAMAITQESGTGRVVAVFTYKAKPYYAVTSGSENVGTGTAFGAKIAVTGAGPVDVVSATTLTADDVISVTSASGFTTIMWSNQTAGAANGFYAGRHKDGDKWGQATAWALSRVTSGELSADNHISLQALADGSGRVYAAVKTSRNDAVTKVPTDPLLQLVRFVPTTAGATAGTWTTTTLTTVTDGGTRPSLVLDRSDGKAYVYYAAPSTAALLAAGRVSGVIYRKAVDYTNPADTSGNTTAAIQHAGAERLNNVSGMAGNANATSGIVEIAVENPPASKSSPARYWSASK